MDFSCSDGPLLYLKDIDRLGSWGMRFQPFKCNMMQLTKKLTHKIQASYNLEDTVLENVVSIKYLVETITDDLQWNTHIINICTKANRTLGFLWRNLFSCPQYVKQLIRKWCVQSYNMEFRSDIPIDRPSG